MLPWGFVPVPGVLAALDRILALRYALCAHVFGSQPLLPTIRKALPLPCSYAQLLILEGLVQVLLLHLCSHRTLFLFYFFCMDYFKYTEKNRR